MNQITDIIRSGELYLDKSYYEALFRRRKIALTRTEFMLLWALASDFGKVLQRKQIIDLVWGPGSFIDPRTVDVYVLRLRKKLKRAVGLRLTVETVYGGGYQLKQQKSGAD